MGPQKQPRLAWRGDNRFCCAAWTHGEQEINASLSKMNAKKALPQA